MKLRIISDLHLDINKDIPLEYDDDVFTVICGDISGNPKETIEWIRKNIKKGVFIEGNHIGYNSNQHGMSIQNIHALLEISFKDHAKIIYLENNHVLLPNDYVFVGGTMWTSFMLGTDNAFGIIQNEKIASQRMNDFRLNLYTDKKTGFQRQLTTSDCLDMWCTTVGYIRDICDQYPDKKIVVVTHHAPSPKSISGAYVNNELNAAYANELDDFIQDHKNIKLWCHGHIHSKSDYMIGNCRVVCNPRGYVRYQENSGFDKNFIVEI